MFSEAFTSQEARRLLDAMRNQSILVIGDIMVDEWIWGKVSRISPEAPVPVVTVSNHSFTLGGAGNVVKNLRALGATVAFAGILGSDAEGDRVLAMLDREEVDRSRVLQIDGRPTTRKTRIVAHNQQVVRADWESTEPLHLHQTEAFCRLIEDRIASYDAVVLSDYAKGVFSRRIIEKALAGKLIVADPKPSNIYAFSGVTCATPNAQEAGEATGIRITDEASLMLAGLSLLDRLRSRYVVITLGERGMALFGAQGEQILIPSVARTVFDVSGAGDTVTAVLALALAADAAIVNAVRLANYSAGVVVEKLGTATATAGEILTFIEENPIVEGSWTDA